MRVSRFYVSCALPAGSTLTLPESTAHYVRNVLRLRQGQTVCLFNGDGTEVPGELSCVDKRRVEVQLGQPERPLRESPLRTEIGLAMSRGERMDYAVQKLSELGVSRIVPLVTERCEVRLNAERSEKRQQHWQQVAISACEQSGRLRPPELGLPMALSDWLAQCQATLKLVCDHRQAGTLPGRETPVDSVALLTGPEGGFSEEEIRQARTAGFQAVALGPRVFRAETAPVVALSLLQWYWGDLQA